MGFRGIGMVGDRTGKWLRCKVFRVFGKTGWGWDSRDPGWDLRGFKRI